MKCEQFLGPILDVAAGLEAPSVVLEGHLRTCAGCSAKFYGLQRTIDLLNEWKCPEPSPYFDPQLRAKLYEATISRKRHWWSFLRRPVLALGLATLVLGGILTVRYTRRSPEVSTERSELEMVPGSAVGDLQMLEEVEKVSGDSDLLDELAPEGLGAANQD
jgi:hypothetical protein